MVTCSITKRCQRAYKNNFALLKVDFALQPRFGRGTLKKTYVPTHRVFGKKYSL
jgi:hypothetical protein